MTGVENWARAHVNRWAQVQLFSEPSAHYAEILAWRDSSRYDLIDQILSHVSTDVFSPSFLVGLLTVTSSCARYLENRVDFFHRVREKLIRLKKTFLLLGLECKEDTDKWTPEK
jgi:hypothetical protein